MIDGHQPIVRPVIVVLGGYFIDDRCLIIDKK
jgi:hypothetical protein